MVYMPYNQTKQTNKPYRCVQNYLNYVEILEKLN